MQGERSGFSGARLPAITSLGNLPKASFIRFGSTSLCLTPRADTACFLILFQLPSPGSCVFRLRYDVVERTADRSAAISSVHVTKDRSKIARDTYARWTVSVPTPKWISRSAEKSKRPRRDFLPAELETFWPTSARGSSGRSTVTRTEKRRRIGLAGN